MTTQEFSDAFDTLLNSYASQAIFGEEASKQEIVLDEYEKSVLLTQAQDIIIKSYFYSNLNPQGQGFDESIRRQADFSSLIKTATLSKSDNQDTSFDSRGIIYNMPMRIIDQPSSIIFNDNENIDTTNKYMKVENYNSESNRRVYVLNTTDVLYILNEKLTISSQATPNIYYTEQEVQEYNMKLGKYIPSNTPLTYEEATAYNTVMQLWKDENAWKVRKSKDDILTKEEVNAYYSALEGAISTIDIKIPATYKQNKDFVVVPLNYKEYDREMSKPYAQPLKKQVWRLFQNNQTGFDIQSELIPLWNISESIMNNEAKVLYKIRYVKRPNPIVLVNLTDDLSIDGIKDVTECSLNPILHMDILNKAVEIAFSTRGKVTPRRDNNNE